MPLSNCALFLMEDSSSSDDSDLEDILFDNDEQLHLMLAAKEEDNKRIKRPGPRTPHVVSAHKPQTHAKLNSRMRF
jgi:hypothetical protein